MMNLQQHCLKIISSVFVVLILQHFSYSQNLVVNPGMEDLPESVPTTWLNNIYRCGVPLAPGWYTPNLGSSDYYNSEFSNVDNGDKVVLALQGEGRIGLIMAYQQNKKNKKRNKKNQLTEFLDEHYREFALGTLREPLVKDYYYDVRFYVAQDPRSKLAADSIGLCFSSEKFCDSTYSSLYEPDIIQPADKIITWLDGWTEISGRYKAKGDEKYIVIGGFSKNAKKNLKMNMLGIKHKWLLQTERRIRNNAYYYIDKVSIVRTDPEKKKYNSNPAKWLFIVDVSSSMAAKGHLDSLKNVFHKLTESLPYGSEISILSFNKKSKLILPFTLITDRESIAKAIDTLKSSGETDFSKAAGTAYDYLDELGEDFEKNTHVVMLTDGNFIVSEIVSGRIRKAHLENQIDFNVFQFGDRTNVRLKKLVEETIGSYIESCETGLDSKMGALIIAKNDYSKNPKIRLSVSHHNIWLFLIIVTAAASPFLLIGG